MLYDSLTTSARRSNRGFAIIGVLFFILITSILLFGIGTFCVSHQTRVKADADYAAAMDVAEAGVNWEYKQLSTSVSNADTTARTVNSPFGVAGTSFVVQCVNRGTSTAWSGVGTSLDVVSTGTANGVSRTVRVASKGFGSGGNYAVYAVKSGSWSSKGHVTGDVGTNGTLTASDTVGINGGLYLNGAGAAKSGSFTYSSLNTSPTPIAWPTVHTLAAAAFPFGGLTWLSGAGNNDNALCTAISNNQINSSGNITFKGKAGGANYYLTQFMCQSSARITVDNTLGPVTIWLGPDGGAGSVSGNPNFDFQSSATITYTSNNPANKCIIYDSTTGPFTLESDATINIGIYAYNTDATGKAIGSVDYRSPTTINGAIVANSITFEAEGYVNYASGYFNSPSTGYYGYDNSWVEVNGR